MRSGNALLFLMFDCICRSHYKMMPDVPIVGWDVAFTSKGVFLLEVENLIIADEVL